MPILQQNLKTVSRVFYAIAMVAFGLLHIGYGDFVTRVVPWWPAGIPGRPLWADLIGALLVVAGGALLFNFRTVTVATTLAAALMASFVLLGIPLAASDALLGGSWTMAGKVLAFCGGALLLAHGRGWWLGIWFFAAFLIICGIQHFLYINFVMSLVPAWIPGQKFWAYAAGVFLIAGGLGLVVPMTTRLAGLLTGLMIFSWVFLVHIPRAAATFPKTSNEMTAVFEALAMAGIAWLAAFSDLPPGTSRRRL
jgi:uncharacterized membrane protein